MTLLATVAAWAPVALAAFLPGAAWVLAAGRTNRSRAESFGTSLALSPGLYGGAIALLLGAGVPLRTATVSALAGFAAAAAVAAWVHSRRPATAWPIRPPDTRITWVIAATVTGLVALFPITSEWWRIDSDAWNHYAITRAIVEHGAHPLDPFFAGIPLQYPWIYHALMASVTTSSGASAFALMPLWSAIALAALLLCAGPTAARLSPRAQVGGLVLLVLGLNAAFPLFMPVLLGKAMMGEVRGWPEVSRTFGLVPISVPRVTSLLTGLGGQDYFLNKFMLPTPFALGLAAYTAFAASLLRWLDGGGRRELWLAGGAVLAAGLMHPVIALGIAGATLGLTALGLLAPGVLGLQRTAAAALSATVLAGLVPVAIYTSGILGGAGSTHRELPIDLSGWKFLGLYSTLALGLLLGVRPILGLVRGGGPRRAWGLWIVLNLAVATTIRTPGPWSFFTVDKFSYIVWIPLALTAGPALGALLAPRGWVARIALVTLLFVPVTGLAIVGRICDPQAPARQPWNLPGWVWMREHLPADAVLMVPMDDAVTTNFVARDQYVSEALLAQMLGYPAREIDARRAITGRVFAGDSLAPADAARLRALGRPVYAVWTRFADPRLAMTRRTVSADLVGRGTPGQPPPWTGRYRIVYDSDTHVVAELMPARKAAPSPITSGVGTPALSR